MTKITLAMLLGAACASAWWAVARWPQLGDGALYIPAVVLSLITVVVVFCESEEAQRV